MLELDKLKNNIPSKVINQTPNVLDLFKINTRLRLAHFLAQCAVESNEFESVQENLNYSSDRLRVVFKKYFPTLALAVKYQQKPEMIASRVYGGRMGNGIESTRDGYKFRGRGYIQLTGKNNYIAFGKVIDIDLVGYPDLVATQYPLLSAAWFFNKNGLNGIADKGATDDVVVKITKIVNGGQIGIVDRLKYFKKYYNLLE
jgi:putative chitinase